MSAAIVSLHRVQAVPRPQEFRPTDPATATRFEASTARLGSGLGLTKLGCNVTVVPAGKAAYPFHSHHAKDELFLILSGRGELRLGAARHPVVEGDLIGCPAGNASTAHPLINTGEAELRNLAIRSSIEPEVCEYPDSGKVGAYCGKGADGFHHLTRSADAADYWAGE